MHYTDTERHKTDAEKMNWEVSGSSMLSLPHELTVSEEEWTMSDMIKQ